MNIDKNRLLKIADIGCGSGGQTFTLAAHLKGEIYAVDLFPEFLNELNSKACELGFEDRIKTVKASMDDLPFKNEELDIIWSEGAIYNMGFEAGIQNWKKFLKKDGYLAVTEITWTTNKRPGRIEDYWHNQYPEIETAANKIVRLEENGFSLEGYFILDKNSWIDNYYKPLEERYTDFLVRHEHSQQAIKIVEAYKEEISIYKSFNAYFGYGFYVARKA